jgi:hypothetical protein
VQLLLLERSPQQRGKAAGAECGAIPWPHASTFRGITGYLADDFESKGMGMDYAFFSASTLEGVAAGLQHGMERTVLFDIECLRTCPGVDVSVLSVCPGEKEVLFAPCTGLSLVQPAVPVDGGLGGGGGARVLRAGAQAGHALVNVSPAAAKESSNSNTATSAKIHITKPISVT